MGQESGSCQQTEFKKASELLERSIENLTETAQVLCIRLLSVLSPAPTLPIEKNIKKGLSTSSPLVAGISVVSEKISSINAELGDVLSRLEI